MKNREQITALVCAGYCRFYRPGKREELSCRGYDFLAEKLSEENVKEISRLFPSAAPPLSFAHDHRVEALLCASCPFRKEDCDFMSGQELAGAVPCGGYVLLSLLLGAGFPLAEEWLTSNE